MWDLWGLRIVDYFLIKIKKKRNLRVNWIYWVLKKKKSFLSSSSGENNIKNFSMILYQTVFVFAFIIYCLFSSFTCQYKSCYTSFLFLFYSSLKPWSAVYSFIPSSVGFSKNINIVYEAMISFHFIIFKKKC